MKASAPKDPAIGSQSVPERKRSAPAFIAGRATSTSSRTITPTTRRIEPPNRPMRPFQTRSPSWRPVGRRGCAASSASPATTVSACGGKRDGLSLHGQGLELLLDLGHHRLRQGGVVERRRRGLAVVDRPPEEL